MISLLIGAALAAAGPASFEAAIDNSRKALVACLKQAASEAKPEVVKRMALLLMQRPSAPARKRRFRTP